MWLFNYVTNLLSSWGESAGAVSVAMHMLANDGDTEGLFCAAFMQSGSPVPVGPLENGQICTCSWACTVIMHADPAAVYDQIVQQVGCAGSADTLECLRTVPFDSLKAAQDATPFIFSFEVGNSPVHMFCSTSYLLIMQSLRLTWLPRADGTFVSDNPQRLVQQGKVANIPFISGMFLFHFCLSASERTLF